MFEDFLLRVELADFVVEQGIFLTLFHARRAADDDDGRFFGEGFRRRVGHFQAADAISDANCAEAADTGIGVGGKAGALFVAGVDEAQLAFGEKVVKAQHVIAGNSKHMPHAMGV